MSCQKYLIGKPHKPLVIEDLPAIVAIRQDDVAGSPLKRRSRKGLSTGLPSLVLEEPTARGIIDLPPKGPRLGSLHMDLRPKHLPPRRFWEFPMRKGLRWTVFFTNEIDKGPTDAPQPPILAERRVADDAASVVTPAYSGSALLVEEWVTGLRKDADGNLVIPSLDDTDGDGTPQRGAPTARYWVAPVYGVVKYEYEYVTLVPIPAFTRKTYVLTAFTAPTKAGSDAAKTP